MYVAWEAAEQVTQPHPVVLVHGGATQGTEWLDTPDGRPGWAQRFVEAGYVVFVVDRPTQGRSPYHPDVDGPMGPAFAYEEGRTVFFPPEKQDQHTQWPFHLEDNTAMSAFIAQFGPLPADLAKSQQMDADRLADLLDLIGPRDRRDPLGIWARTAGCSPTARPDLVRAIVTVEPMGPAFAKIPNIGTLEWGLTAAPITYDPPLETPQRARDANPETLRIPALASLPVARRHRRRIPRSPETGPASSRRYAPPDRPQSCCTYPTHGVPRQRSRAHLRTKLRRVISSRARMARVEGRGHNPLIDSCHRPRESVRDRLPRSRCQRPHFLQRDRSTKRPTLAGVCCTVSKAT